MKKALIILAVVVLAVVLGWVYLMPKGSDEGVSASQVSAEDKKATGALAEKDADADYRIFKSTHGDVKIPKNPQRIVVLSTSSSMGSILQFGADKVVGHEKWSSYSPIFAPYLKNSTLIDANNLEQIMSLQPDLIITNPESKNFAELSKIAPTLESFSREHYSYLDAVVEYADLVNKKAEAETWVKNFKARCDKVGAELKSKYGEDVSVSVMDVYGDELYLYGDNWGRGTQILYRQMGLKMPDEVKNVALEKGYYSISTEVLPKYAGDLMILVHYKGSNLAFMETETWKTLPALKAGNVMIVEDGEGFYHADSMTLAHQLDLIENYFLQGTSASQVSAEDEKATGALTEKNPEAKSEFRAFPSVGGEVMIPKDPQRVAVLLPTSMGNILKFGGKVIAYEKWAAANPLFAGKLDGATLVAKDNPEQVLALKPDLIILEPKNKKYAEFSKIAPTVAIDFLKMDYLDFLVETSNLIGKKAEAEAWVKDFQARGKKAGKAMKAKYGEDVSASVFALVGDQIYLLGDNWGRGTQVIYREMNLKMPDAVKKVAQEKGFHSVSAEMLPEYAADLILVVEFKGSNTSFLQTKTWKNIPAVKKGNFMQVEGEGFNGTDAISLDDQLQRITDFFLTKKK